MPQPEVSGLYIEGHLTYVMLNIRIVRFVLHSQVLDGEIVSGFGSAQKACRVVRDETGLPSFLEVLPRIADQILFRNKSLLKANQVADRTAHADWIPPGTIE